ncbi:hypothetical protein ENBRE01_1352 [Enteropsectra breve]|nr:hypothetical protein ENBRE01_1352 [Enteropsectra breve]
MRMLNGYWIMCHAAALYVFSNDYVFGDEIRVAITNGSETLDSYDYGDLRSCSRFMGCAKQQDEDGEKAEHIRSMHSMFSNVLNTYEEVAKSERKGSESPESFYQNVQRKTAVLLQENPDFVTLKNLKKKEKFLGKGYNIGHLDIVFKMRKNLLIHKRVCNISTLLQILELYEHLAFAHGSYTDVFIGEHYYSTPTHILMERNTLFAINIAINLKRLDYFSKYKSVLMNPETHKDCKSDKYLARFLNAMKPFKYVCAVISIIDITYSMDNKISDIVVSHAGQAFGFGLHRSGFFLLKPKFAFGTEKHCVASAFKVFDCMTAFPSIVHLRAVCHEEMAENLAQFYLSILRVFPSINDVELEESLKGVYEEECDNSETPINSVLKAILTDRRVVRKLQNFSIVGYNVLSDEALALLRWTNFKQLGLYGKYLFKDCFYTLKLFTGSSVISDSITSYKSSPTCIYLISKLLKENQLKEGIFIRGLQNEHVYYDWFAGNEEELNLMRTYFHGYSIESAVQLEKHIELETMAIIYKFYQYNLRTIEEKRFLTKEAFSLQVMGSHEKIIFSICKAQMLILGSEFYSDAGFAQDAIKRIRFYVSEGQYIPYAALYNAVSVASLDGGRIEINVLGCADIIRTLSCAIPEQVTRMYSGISFELVMQPRTLAAHNERELEQNEHFKEIVKMQNNRHPYLKVGLEQQQYPSFVGELIKSISID